ncbi:olfactory receptor 1468-like [Hyperolius riggenbachi]|uniref:olfactory receptor 1468-like n=1 Tax=Hyperolius riggenbachi TaxID=752182 RepID=UPI0035A2BD9D
MLFWMELCFVLFLPSDTQGSSQSNVTSIFLLGFHDTGKFTVLLFIFLLLIFCGTLCGNLLIITLVSISKTLHSPMYFFLTQLSITDLMLSTNISPNMLNIVLHSNTSIPFFDCVTQYYFFCFSEGSECFLLMAMSYDRYVAICHPLHYVSIITPGLCTTLVVLAWLLSFIVTTAVTFYICQLQFCGPNTIDHFYCDVIPLIELSCSDVSSMKMDIALMGIPVVILPFLAILVSYMGIVWTILKISSISGRQKCFSTCSSHLTVVCLFYWSIIAIYIIPNEDHSQMGSKIMSMLYTVFTPLLNPCIYSLRNEDIKNALKNVVV